MGGFISAIFGGGDDDFDMPVQQAEQAVRTAEPAQTAGLSDTAKRNKRLAASMLTRDWGQLNTSKSGLMAM